MVDKNFAGLRAKILYLVLLQLHGLSWTVATHCSGDPEKSGEAEERPRRGRAGQLTFQKPVDDRVEIDLRCSIRHDYVSSPRS